MLKTMRDLESIMIDAHAAHEPTREKREQMLTRVLVVDDNAISQLVTLQQLKALDCHAQTASSGIAALAVAMREHFDLILLDCRMPDIDGYTTARAIREIEASGERRRAAIVAITGDTDIACVDKCLSSGMDGHLSKPTSVATLRAVLNRFLV
jgi:CheY-like chemotaxis protein